MVVDDERFILEITGEWLSELGYDVIEASSGQEALSLYEAQRKIDLVILDLVMPGMDGGETFSRLQIIDPEVKVLLISGYGLDGRVAKISDKGCRGFIQKPFTIIQLSEKIKSILTGHPLQEEGALQRVD